MTFEVLEVTMDENCIVIRQNIRGVMPGPEHSASVKLADCDLESIVDLFSIEFSSLGEQSRWGKP